MLSLFQKSLNLCHSLEYRDKKTFQKSHFIALEVHKDKAGWI